MTNFSGYVVHQYACYQKTNLLIYDTTRQYLNFSGIDVLIFILTCHRATIKLRVFHLLHFMRSRPAVACRAYFLFEVLCILTYRFIVTISPVLM